jgi:hypothetical protein
VDRPNRTEGPVRIPRDARAVSPPTSIIQSRGVPVSQSRLAKILPASGKQGAGTGRGDLVGPQRLLLRTLAFEAPSWRRTLKVMRTEGT